MASTAPYFALQNTATPGSSHLRLNIALEIVVFSAKFVVLSFDGVADRNKADEPSALHYGHMADAALSHDAHDVGYFVVGRGDDRAARHPLGDLQEFERSARGGTGPQDIALSNDADHFVVLHDNERADVVSHHQVCHIGERIVRRAGMNMLALVRENIANVHDPNSPPLGNETSLRALLWPPRGRDWGKHPRRQTINLGRVQIACQIDLTELRELIHEPCRDDVHRACLAVRRSVCEFVDWENFATGRALLPGEHCDVPRDVLTTDIRGQLILLGTGTSTGVPSIGCPCEVCASTDPRDKRTRCAALVGLPQGNLLIDTPPDRKSVV